MYIQELSDTIGLSKKAIQLYEEKGLIHPIKDKKGYRSYSQRDIHILRKVKILRELDFHLWQIQKILINHDVSIFDDHKLELHDKRYEIDTSLQYIELLKNHIFDDDNEYLEEIEDVYQLKYIQDEDNLEIDFQKVILVIMFFLLTLSLNYYTDIIMEIIVTSALFIILIIYFSSRTRLLIFQVYKKVKKYLTFPKG